jgi:hypothetical protein
MKEAYWLRFLVLWDNGEVNYLNHFIIMSIREYTK